MKQITKLIFPIALLFTVQSAFSQIVGQKTDSNYYNTTVVMVKENTTDATVLTAMNDGFGMGDVLRIEVAKPQPKFVVNNIATPATAAPRQINTTPRPTVKPIERNSVVQNKPDSGLSKEQIKPAAKSAVAANPAPIKQVQVTATTSVVKAPRIAKTSTSSTKKAVKKKKCKSRPPYMASVWRKKPGKQKYSCPKF